MPNSATNPLGVRQVVQNHHQYTMMSAKGKPITFRRQPRRTNSGNLLISHTKAIATISTILPCSSFVETTKTPAPLIPLYDSPARAWCPCGPGTVWFRQGQAKSHHQDQHQHQHHFSPTATLERAVPFHSTPKYHNSVTITRVLTEETIHSKGKERRTLYQC